MLRAALILAGILFAETTLSCTSAVISGRATRDGRPILWKQRDTGRSETMLVPGTGGTYRFLGVHDLADTARAECFMGSNETGFSIMNTASYNLQYPAYPGPMDEEGKLMREALATCRTLGDFERLLERTSGKRGVEANFGVIDAEGGAAYYETDPYRFVKYDASDPAVAPEGYLIRTNFSMSGTPETGQGYIRYQTTANLFTWARLGNGISVAMILLEATGNLTHALTGADLARGPLPASAEARTMVHFVDYVPRYSTAASMIIHGVRPGDDPARTTVWTILGSPLTTPVVPVWVQHADRVPAMLLSAGGRPAPLNAMSLALKGRCFPLRTPEGKGYLDLARVVNGEGTGTLQRLKEVHRRVLELVAKHEETAARRTHPAVVLYPQIDVLIREYYASYGIR